MCDAGPVRTLVIGAGVAGLTLAGLLEQQGRAPTIVERSEQFERGYAIGLYPLGSCVLHGLGAYERLRERALVLERYELASETGRVLQAVDFSTLTGKTGPLLMVGRADLIAVLEASCRGADLRRGASVASLVPRAGAVEATFTDGATAEFDVVLACDGIGSPTRDFVCGPASGDDSGWLLWTWWVDRRHFDPTVTREWWGTGCFFGVYPAPDHVMCAAGGPAGAVRGDDTRAALLRQLGTLIDHVPVVGTAIEAMAEAYPWPMADVRAERWVNGRIALCGDAAVGFMPTAGVGAVVRDARRGRARRRTLSCRRGIDPVGPRVVREAMPEHRRARSDRFAAARTRDVRPAQAARPGP